MTGTSPRIRRSARRFLRPAGTAVRIALATTTLLVSAAVATSPAAASTQRVTERDWNGWTCDGYYLRMNTPTPGMVLEYDQASDNKAIYQRPWTNAPTQQWEACRSSTDPKASDYIFRSKADGRCITLWGGYQLEGHWFSVDSCDGSYIGANQRFWRNQDPGSRHHAPGPAQSAVDGDPGRLRRQRLARRPVREPRHRLHLHGDLTRVRR